MDIVKAYGIGEMNYDRYINDDDYMVLLGKKKGKEFLYDLDCLFWKQFYTMNDVANKYHLTRERIRQIFSHLYGIGMNDVSVEKTNILKREMRDGCQLDGLSRAASYVNGNCPVHRGAKSEAVVQSMAISRGMDVLPSDTYTVDLKINGYYVEVKGCGVKAWTGNKSYYRFFSREKQRELTDFYAIHIVENDDVYIIPSSEIVSDYSYITKKTEKYNGAWSQLA